jgi:L-lactate dehydrogenase complex protein LldF
VNHRVLHPPRAEPAPAVTLNLHRAAGNWGAKRAAAKLEVDWEAWRERAREVRADGIAHLPELIERFEAEVRAAGGEVHHAATAEQASSIIVSLCQERGARSVAKAKSMTSEETGLNEALGAAGIEPVETDLGEFIVQQLGDRPSHVLAPAVHLNAGQVAELFTKLSGDAYDSEDTERLVSYARGVLRERFAAAEVGITGGNLLVAETGTICLVESEGNIRLSSSLPRTHIALVGIEKIVRDWAGAVDVLKILPLAAHGKPAAASTSLITGPARDGDDGPRELHVVLLDAGRSALRGTAYEEALHCIRCGACLYACPVYRQTGGHAYGTAYSGPIGAVLTPALEQHSPETAGLPWMSSLCGACTEACPVKIPLDRQLVLLRADAERADPHRGEAALFEAWARLWSRPASYRATAKTAGKALSPLLGRLVGARDGWLPKVPFPFAGWTSERDARAPAAVPFHERWRRARANGIDEGHGSRGASEGGVSKNVQHAAGFLTSPPEETAAPAAPPTSTPSSIYEFARRFEELDGKTHQTPSLEAAHQLARELIGDATVARWQDAMLDGISGRLAEPTDADVSLIAADAAVGETGQVVWRHGPGRPRAAGVLPPRQVILLDAGKVTQTLEDAVNQVGTGSVVLVAGPSRTADIEQRLIRGMHAPREIDVIIFER